MNAIHFIDEYGHQIFVDSCPCGQASICHVQCIDRNECLDETHTCNAQEICENTYGSFTCNENVFLVVE